MPLTWAVIVIIRLAVSVKKIQSTVSQAGLIPPSSSSKIRVISLLKDSPNTP